MRARTNHSTSHSERAHIVSCRIDVLTLAHVDLLVDAGLHRTRSAAATWLLRAGIRAQQPLLERIAPVVQEIARARRRVRAAVSI